MTALNEVIPIEMTVDKLQTKELDGATWYRAIDVAKLYHLPDTPLVTRCVDPTDKRRVRVGTLDWKRDWSEAYISRNGLLAVALRYSRTPLHELAARLA